MFNVSFENTNKIVALLEASLINIYKPEYNTEYKNSSSSKMFKTLEELYHHGFNESIINIIVSNKDRGAKISFYANNKRIDLEDNNLFCAQLMCPFVLS